MYATVSLRMTDRPTAMMRRERMDGFETRIWVTANNHLRKLLRWFESAILLRDSRIGSWTGAPFPTFHSVEEKSVTYILSQWYWIRWLSNLLATFVFIEFRCFSFVHFSERTRSLRCYFASTILFSPLASHNFSDTFLSQMVNVLDICEFRCSCERI